MNKVITYELLQCCFASADDYAGFGNGFHATGGCGTKRAHMRQCLRLIRSIVSTCDDAVITDLTEQGAIHQLACQFMLLLLCYSFFKHFTLVALNYRLIVYVLKFVQPLKTKLAARVACFCFLLNVLKFEFY